MYYTAGLLESINCYCVLLKNDFNNYLEQLDTVDAQSLNCDAAVPAPFKWVWRPFAVKLKWWDLDESGIYWELVVDDAADDDEVTQVPVEE